MIQPLTPQEQKAIAKEALREWLDDKYMHVGKWTVHGFLALMVVASAYFVLMVNGWHK